jgi:hypothetical protein
VPSARSRGGVVATTGRDVDDVHARPLVSGRFSQVRAGLTKAAPYLWLVNGTAVAFVSERMGNYQWHPQWGVLLNQLWVR